MKRETEVLEIDVKTQEIKTKNASPDHIINCNDSS